MKWFSPGSCVGCLFPSWNLVLGTRFEEQLWLWSPTLFIGLLSHQIILLSLLWSSETWRGLIMSYFALKDTYYLLCGFGHRACHTMYTETREQLSGLGSLFSSCESWDSGSVSSPVCTELPCCPSCIVLRLLVPLFSLPWNSFLTCFYWDMKF